MKSIKLISANEIAEILRMRENEIINVISDAYLAFNQGYGNLPQSVFLRFPDNNSNRIIALPAYLGDKYNIAGIKWISSFPENITKNIERASALLVINEMNFGRPIAVLESSVISAKRTAASAALAASLLHNNVSESVVGIIGCGKINGEVLNFLKIKFPKINKAILFDCKINNAQQFADNLLKKYGIKSSIVNSYTDVFKLSSLVSVATTASIPYITSLDIRNEQTVLNVSLRDFSADVILKCNNVVDNLHHVCREKTSIHLASLETNTTDFVNCEIADLISGNYVMSRNGKPVIFSPFGLGTLDLALGAFVLDKAEKNKIGTVIDNFLN